MLQLDTKSFFSTSSSQKKQTYSGTFIEAVTPRNQL